MTRLPQLQRELVAAAQRRNRAAPVRLAARIPRVALPAAALAVVVAALLIQPFEVIAPDTPAAVAPVPAETLRKSAALTRMPAVRPSGVDEDHVRVRHDDLPRVAREIEAQTPYPPGRSDDFDWEALPRDSLNARSDVQALVENRAVCHWLGYWLTAHAAGAAGPQRQAVQVLEGAADWPTARGTPGADPRDAYSRLAAAARRADAATVSRDLGVNCRGVGGS